MVTPMRTTAFAPTNTWSPRRVGRAVDRSVGTAAHASSDGRVRVDLRAAADVAARTDAQAARAVDHRERPDPRSLADLGLADEQARGWYGFAGIPMIGSAGFSPAITAPRRRIRRPPTGPPSTPISGSQPSTSRARRDVGGAPAHEHVARVGTPARRRRRWSRSGCGRARRSTSGTPVPTLKTSPECAGSRGATTTAGDVVHVHEVHRLLAAAVDRRAARPSSSRSTK